MRDSSGELTDALRHMSVDLRTVFHEQGLWGLPDRHSASLRWRHSAIQGYQLSRSAIDIVSNGHGLTVADLYNAASTVSATHQTCAHQAEHEYDPFTGDIVMNILFAGSIGLEYSPWAHKMTLIWDFKQEQAFQSAQTELSGNP